MAKTFTESTHPDREFVPIRRDTVDDVTNPLPVDSATTLTVRCELVSQPVSVTAETTSGSRVMTSSDSVSSATSQLRDLTSEFRHLQSLLDDLSSTAVQTDHVDTSSEEELSEDWQQPTAGSRVVYRYHLREKPSTSRRWIRRADDTTSQDVTTQHQECLVGDENSRQGQSDQHHERQMEHDTPQELKTQHQECLVGDENSRQGQSDQHHERQVDDVSQVVEELETQNQKPVVEVVEEDKS